MNRQTRRALKRLNEKADELRTGRRTEAKVMALMVGYKSPGTVGAYVRCGCGKDFTFSEIPFAEFVRDTSKVGKDEQAPASTGPWVEGRCPQCGRGHRVRATAIVIVEEEDLDAPLANQNGTTYHPEESTSE